MGASPLRDPVEGGFFRYATRADWSEPHYERMLTDNALLLDVAAELADRRRSAGLRCGSLADGVIGFLTRADAARRTADSRARRTPRA